MPVPALACVFFLTHYRLGRRFNFFAFYQQLMSAAIAAIAQRSLLV